jgi:hypothetical protein
MAPRLGSLYNCLSSDLFPTFHQAIYSGIVRCASIGEPLNPLDMFRWFSYWMKFSSVLSCHGKLDMDCPYVLEMPPAYIMISINIPRALGSLCVRTAEDHGIAHWYDPRVALNLATPEISSHIAGLVFCKSNLPYKIRRQPISTGLLSLYGSAKSRGSG